MTSDQIIPPVLIHDQRAMNECFKFYSGKEKKEFKSHIWDVVIISSS